MQTNESATVKQYRRNLIKLRELLLLDGRTKEAKKKEAQSRLLIATASDEELQEMAKLEADFFDIPVDEALKELRETREEHRTTVASWRKNLGKVDHGKTKSSR